MTHLDTCAHVPIQLTVLDLLSNSTQMILLLSTWKDSLSGEHLGQRWTPLYLASEGGGGHIMQQQQHSYQIGFNPLI